MRTRGRISRHREEQAERRPKVGMWLEPGRRAGVGLPRRRRAATLQWVPCALCPLQPSFFAVSFSPTLKRQNTLHLVLVAPARKSQCRCLCGGRLGSPGKPAGAGGLRLCGFPQISTLPPCLYQASVGTFINSCLKMEPLFLACPDGRLQGRGGSRRSMPLAFGETSELRGPVRLI